MDKKQTALSVPPLHPFILHLFTPNLLQSKPTGISHPTAVCTIFAPTPALWKLPTLRGLVETKPDGGRRSTRWAPAIHAAGVPGQAAHAAGFPGSPRIPTGSEVRGQLEPGKASDTERI